MRRYANKQHVKVMPGMLGSYILIGFCNTYYCNNIRNTMLYGNQDLALLRERMDMLSRQGDPNPMQTVIEFGPYWSLPR